MLQPCSTRAGPGARHRAVPCVNVAAAAPVTHGAHGEDYDDTFEGGPVHAGAVIVPALLATAEQQRCR
jgi:2-methylcitrate dehydratase PrpD